MDLTCCMHHVNYMHEIIVIAHSRIGWQDEPLRFHAKKQHGRINGPCMDISGTMVSQHGLVLPNESKFRFTVV